MHEKKKSKLSFLTNNLGLKVLSLVLSVVIWYVIVAHDDPKEVESFTVPVTVINDAYIANGKQSYRIEGDYQTVIVTIQDNHSVLKRITEKDITVTADLTQIVDLNRDPVMVPLTVKCNGVSDKKITLSRQTIPIVIEDIGFVELPVRVDTGDTKPAIAYEVGTMTPEIPKLTIVGPVSVIDEINSVVARIDVTNMNMDATRTAQLLLYDKDQKEISADELQETVTIQGGIRTLQVDVSLWKKVSGIRLNVSTSGYPAEGYQAKSITTTPAELTLAGSKEALEALAAAKNLITVPPEMVNINGASEDVSVDLKIADLLPEGLKVASTMPEDVVVTVSILPVDSVSLKYDVDKIELQNLAQGLLASFDRTNIPMKIKATSGEIQNITADRITASIDLNGLMAGDYQNVPVNVKLPEGYTLLEPVTVTLHIKPIAGG